MSQSNISINKLKFIQSLHQKKYRQQNQAFLVEGAKNVVELLLAPSYEIQQLYVTEDFAKKYTSQLRQRGVEFVVCNEETLTRAGTLQTNDAALAVVTAKQNTLLVPEASEWILALDQVRDPGNLGTIVRIADWYGIRKIVCSDNTAEIYNPKVIAATMGSFTRIEICYAPLPEYLSKYVPQNMPIYGAFLGGENVHKTDFGAQGGVLIMGNESNGICEEVAKYVRHSIAIPQYGHAESLNVAIATAVLCDNIRRSTER